MANMVDFAADDAWVAVELSGESVQYTPSGGTATAKSLVIKPQESRLVDNNGFLFEVHRVRASGLADSYAPEKGDSFVHDGKSWDYAGSCLVSGGMASAFFESMAIKDIGFSGTSPV